MKNKQETLDKHTAKFIATVCENLPKGMPGKAMDYWIDNPKELQKVLKDGLDRFVVPSIEGKKRALDNDPYSPQKQKISLFYRECFNLEIDWSGITISKGPSDFKRLELIIQSLTEDQIFEAYAKRFGEDKVSKVYESISKSIKRDKGGEPLRPKTDYPLLHIGGDEPDKKHLNKSYNDFDGDGNKYMIVKEGMIAAFRYRFETGKMYDVKGLTRFHSLDSGGDAICMCRYHDGRWDIGRSDRDVRDSGYGPRSVSF